MSRYNEIVEEFDIDVCTDVTREVAKKVAKSKSWRLYRLDLMYVYPMGGDQICHRRYATKMVVAKDDDAVVDFRIKGKWRDMKWKQYQITENEIFLKKIMQYNKDDCFATLKIAEYLIKNQLKKN